MTAVGRWNRRGTVYLVGAGPGDPGLITRRGLACLERADVVVYDRLVPPALLGEAPTHAERVCAAKAPGRRRLDQRQIERLVIDRAKAGKTVVRLKGGDPFVFGRGGEESLALKHAGIPFEVVPGISSPLAVPASAGIPVTHRGASGAFAVWTAHRSAGGPVQAVDAPTQVILMGAETLRETAEHLLSAGRAPETPAAVISWGTTVRQRSVFGTLADIAERARRAGLSAPATVIVGEVVRVGQDLASLPSPADGVLNDALLVTGFQKAAADPTFTRLFAGKRVALTRKLEGDPLATKLEACGAEVAALPAGEFRRTHEVAFVDAVRRLEASAHVVFADSIGVHEAMRLRLENGLDARSLRGVRIGALEDDAREALLSYGIAPDLAEIDSTEPALLIEGFKGAAPIAATEMLPSGSQSVWAGEWRPAVQVIRCLFDMIEEEMIDAVLFDGTRSLEMVRAFAANHERRVELSGFPAFTAVGDAVNPSPVTTERETESEGLIV